MDRRVVKSRASLRAALVDQMQTTPIGDISVTNVADAADVPRKTFYQHYKTVDELWSDVIDEVMAGFFADLTEDELRLPLGEAALWVRVLGVWVQRRAVIEAAFTNGVSAVLFDRLEVHGADLIDRLTVANGLPPRSAADTEYFASYIAGVTVGAMSRWVRRGVTDDIPVLLEWAEATLRPTFDRFFDTTEFPSKKK